MNEYDSEKMRHLLQDELHLLPSEGPDGASVIVLNTCAIREKAQEKGFYVGLFIVGGLMVFSFWNDLVHLKVVEKVLSFF